MPRLEFEGPPLLALDKRRRNPASSSSSLWHSPTLSGPGLLFPPNSVYCLPSTTAHWMAATDFPSGRLAAGDRGAFNLLQRHWLCETRCALAYYDSEHAYRLLRPSGSKHLIGCSDINDEKGSIVNASLIATVCVCGILFFKIAVTELVIMTRWNYVLT